MEFVFGFIIAGLFFTIVFSMTFKALESTYFHFVPSNRKCSCCTSPLYLRHQPAGASGTSIYTCINEGCQACGRRVTVTLFKGKEIIEEADLLAHPLYHPESDFVEIECLPVTP